MHSINYRFVIHAIYIRFTTKNKIYLNMHHKCLQDHNEVNGLEIPSMVNDATFDPTKIADDVSSCWMSSTKNVFSFFV